MICTDSEINSRLYLQRKNLPLGFNGGVNTVNRVWRSPGRGNGTCKAWTCKMTGYSFTETFTEHLLGITSLYKP